MNQHTPHAAKSAPANRPRGRRLPAWSGALLALALLPVAVPAQAAVYAYAGVPAEGARAVRLSEAADGSLHALEQAAPAPADTAGTAPAAPSMLSVSVNHASNEATLNWNAVDTATSYNVYEGSTPGGESATPILSNITGTTATISGLNPRSSYYFTVAAVNEAGVSGPSPEASVTPINGTDGAFAPALLAPLLGAALLRRRKARARTA